MKITQEPQQDHLRLVFEGRLDGAWSEPAQRTLTEAIEAGWHTLALDLGGITFLSSAGVRVLILHYKKLAQIDGALTIVNPSPEVRSVLEMSGLGMMIAASSPTDGKVENVTPVPFESHHLECERYSMHPEGRLSLTFRPPHPPCEGSQRLPLPKSKFGLGIAAAHAEERAEYGEFLAAAGAAILQPADGKQTTDYLLARNAYIPEIDLLSGLIAEGEFQNLLRFESRNAPNGPTPLSNLIHLLQAEIPNEGIGFVMIAEAASLVGAALSHPLHEQEGVRLRFPEVRNQLLFTGEPAWRKSLTLVTGFFFPSALSLEAPLQALLRPVTKKEGAPLYHAHATVFPYEPLPKHFIDLQTSIRRLLEAQPAQGVLHLLNDWRPLGIGESLFHRGALWYAPLQPPYRLL